MKNLEVLFLVLQESLIRAPRSLVRLTAFGGGCNVESHVPKAFEAVIKFVLGLAVPAVYAAGRLQGYVGNRQEGGVVVVEKEAERTTVAERDGQIGDL